MPRLSRRDEGRRLTRTDKILPVVGTTNSMNNQAVTTDVIRNAMVKFSL